MQPSGHTQDTRRGSGTAGDSPADVHHTGGQGGVVAAATVKATGHTNRNGADTKRKAGTGRKRPANRGAAGAAELRRRGEQLQDHPTRGGSVTA